MTEQPLPGGVALRIGYDANRTPVTRTYVRTSDDAEIATSSVVENSRRAVGHPHDRRRHASATPMTGCSG